MIFFSKKEKRYEKNGKLIRFQKYARIYDRGTNIPLYTKWENGSEVRKYSRGIFPTTVEEWRKEFTADNFQTRDFVQFEIWHKEDKCSIGLATLHHIKWQDRIAELGILIGDPQYWNRQIAFEATIMLFKYGFEELNLHKISASMFEKNEASWKCAEKCGMTREGTLRLQRFVEGQYQDEYIYSIFQDEWLQRSI
jgi:RimJ/RimL family protein N-acetyltransferase